LELNDVKPGKPNCVASIVATFKLVVISAIHRAGTNQPALLTMIRRIIVALRLWRERAHSREQLREYNDYLLRDIGLRREQVGYEYPKPYSHCD
jgi:uncharacterized protein YjiS (DUF1127 family)